MAPHILDSHVHLFEAAELDTLAWYAPGHVLGADHTPAEYAAAVASPDALSATKTTSGRVAGYIYVETDRKHDLASSPPDYSGPLAELAYLRRVLEAPPVEGGGGGGGAPACVAIVPWAPMPLGAAAVEAYLADAERVAGPDVWRRVRGFRYLVQDKPAGTMVGDGFVDALRLLGKKGFAFDLGVDAHRRERSHLAEAVEMVGRAHEGVPDDERVVIVVNHLLKPNLAILNPADPAFDAWRTAVYSLSCFPRTYLKLSGGFSEMPAALLARGADEPKDVADAMLPWLGIVLAAFGAERIMFGSDWPVCTAAGREPQDGAGTGDKTAPDGHAWARWKAVVERMVWMGTIDDRGLERIWGGTAREAYRIEEEASPQ